MLCLRYLGRGLRLREGFTIGQDLRIDRQPGQLWRRWIGSGLLLAALHFTENASRPQAKRRDGKERFTVKFPKYKKGGATVCKVPTEATYGYLGELMACLVEFCRRGTLGEEPPAAVADDPPLLAASFVRPDKEEAIRAHQSRFQKE